MADNVAAVVRLMLVTDAIRAAGAGDGESELGGQPVVIADGAARLRDGTLAGSVLTMDEAVRNAVACGLDLTQAAALAATVPADYLGLADRGRLAEGARADLVVLGTHGRSAVLDVLIGSTAKQILSALSCNALVVRAPRAAMARVAGA